jgi:acyl-CoA dehydrogenase
MAKAAGVLTPHICRDGQRLNQRQTAAILKKTGLSPLGPVARNTMAPDEGNMFLLGRIATEQQKSQFLTPLIDGSARSAFLMTEPPDDDGAGSDPSMMRTTAVHDGAQWVLNGRKALITGFQGAQIGIVMANSGTTAKPAATMFLVELPNPAITLERVLDTLDNSMPGGHAVLSINNLRVPAGQLLGAPHEGFAYAQVRLSPARLSHCMRWHGAATRAYEIAVSYACRRHAFGQLLIDHEGVGFQLAQSMIDLQ